jgi:hypothetical protein
MAYCAPADVKKLINTDLNDTELQAIIADADQDLDDELDGATMTEANKKYCSARLVAIVIGQQQRSIFKADGSTSQGGYSVREWKKEVKEKIGKASGRWLTVDSLEE